MSGVVASFHYRPGLSRSPEYLEIEGTPALRTEPLDALADNINPAQVIAYDGWFYAPLAGRYHFDLPRRRIENSTLGEFRAAYQSQLRLGDTVVLRRDVAGRLPTGQADLTVGWHRVSLRLGSSPASATVTFPDGQTRPLDTGLLHRPAHVRLHPVGRTGARAVWEIYAPTSFVLTAPDGVAGRVHYTLNGTLPTAASPVADSEPVLLAETAALTAIVLHDGAAMTLPTRTEVRRVARPTVGEVARIDLTQWRGETGTLPLDDRCRVWLAPFAEARVVAGRHALFVPPLASMVEGLGTTDRNVARPVSRTPLKLNDLRLLDPEFTVGLWFLTDQTNGRLLGKEGLTAFGKSYRTISLRIANGRIRGEPGALSGPAIRPGQWHHAALSVTPIRLTLYLDGVAVATGPGSTTLATDALDALADHAATLGEVAVFIRELSAEDVARWAAAAPPSR